MRIFTLPVAFFLLIFFTAIALPHASAQQKEMVTETTIEQTNYYRKVFPDYADFWDKKYFSPVSFESARFNAVEFNNTEFNSEAKFFAASFDSIVDFQDVHFKAKAIFEKANFKTKATFLDVVFDSLTDFSYINLIKPESNRSKLYFNRSKFNAEADFTNAIINTVDFTEAEFNSDVFFTSTEFDSLAIFSKAEFNSDVDFTSSKLPNKLDFSYTTKISGDIDLTSATIYPKYDICYINLTGAAIDKFKFRYKRFKLWFPENNTIDFELKSNVYEVLLKNQDDQGFTQSYEKLDKEYREFKYTGQEGSKISRFWGHLQNWVDKYWWGYGYNKELIVFNSIILYLLFAFINAFFLKHLTQKVYEAEKINEYWEESSGSKIGMFFKTIPFSMFYTAQIFFGFRFDVDKLKYKENLQGWKIFSLVYFFLVYLSGLVCFAYLANYVVTV